MVHEPPQRAVPPPEGAQAHDLVECDTRVGLACLAVIDRAGLFGLSVEAVAAELDCRLDDLHALAERLGRPVAEVLIDLAVDRVYAEIDLQPSALMWTDRFKFYARSFRAALLRHPEAAYSVGTRPVVSLASMQVAEHALGELTGVGFTATHANRILLVMVSFVVGHAMLEIGADDERFGGHRPDDVAEFRSTLPADEVPLAARSVADVDRDAEFELGLGLLVGGLERQLLHAAP